MAASLPNGPLQVVFSFDTTGSMSGALTEVRGRISDMLQRLQADIRDVTTSVVAHGDYDDIYVTKHVDFTNDLPCLVDFVTTVGSTHGGDEPEAYEVMLRLVRRDLKWTSGSQRVLVVIGDSYPHPPSYPQNKENIDWRKEIKLLAEMGVRIYGVQVDSTKQSSEFFEKITSTTGGLHLKLSEFSTLCDVIMAICYREKGAEFFQNYELEVRAREGRKTLHHDLEGVFGSLRRADSAAELKLLPTSTSPVSEKPKTIATLKKSPKKTFITAIVSNRKLPRKLTSAAKNAKPSFRKLIREKVPDINFRFNNLRWSPWKLAVIPAGVDKTAGHWRRFLGDVARTRKTTMMAEVKTRKQGAVVCEVAVQTRPGAHRHVVWCRVLPAQSAHQLSFSRLMSSRNVRAQLLRVMRNGCRVWFRWAGVNRRQPRSELVREINELYDYAWCASNGCHRDVWVPNGKPSIKIQISAKIA